MGASSHSTVTGLAQAFSHTTGGRLEVGLTLGLAYSVFADVMGAGLPKGCLVRGDIGGGSGFVIGCIAGFAAALTGAFWAG